MILLISDTHNNSAALKRIAEIYSSQKLSALIHLGDVTDFSALEVFRDFACAKYLVKGNGDVIDLAAASLLKSMGFDFSNPPFEIFVNGFGHIALMHEPYFIEEYLDDNKTNNIFYGHTHAREDKTKNGKRIVNPGALTDCMNFRRSYAIVKTDSVEFKTI